MGDPAAGPSRDGRSENRRDPSKGNEMIIAHISDLHALAPGQKLMNVLDVNALARDAVSRVNALEVRPDVVIVTGDLTHNGREDEMRNARDVLDALEAPYVAIPGGHDDQDVFEKVFTQSRPDRDAWREGCAGIDVAGVRLVFLNSLSQGEGASVEKDQAARIDALLAERPDAPTVVCMHHPPFQCRIPVATYIDDPEASWAEDLRETISLHRQVKLVLCGHVHRSMVTPWAGANVAVAPSTCVQVDPNFTEFYVDAHKDRRNFQLIAEDPAFMIHYWNGRDFITYTLPTRDDYQRA